MQLPGGGSRPSRDEVLPARAAVLSAKELPAPLLRWSTSLEANMTVGAEYGAGRTNTARCADVDAVREKGAGAAFG